MEAMTAASECRVALRSVCVDAPARLPGANAVEVAVPVVCPKLG